MTGALLLLVQEDQQVPVCDILLTIRKFGEGDINLLEIAIVQIDSQFVISIPKSMPSGVFSQYQAIRRNADGLRRHDFVRRRLLQNAILMNSSLMRKSVIADDRLFPLNRRLG